MEYFQGEMYISEYAFHRGYKVSMKYILIVSIYQCTENTHFPNKKYEILEMNVDVVKLERWVEHVYMIIIKVI